jgi:hypothetical protein
VLPQHRPDRVAFGQQLGPLSAFAAGRWTDALRIILFAAAALLALRTSLVTPRTARLILTAVLAGSAIMITPIGPKRGLEADRT